ncbi:MAG TPA: alpha/beta hydrolase [Brevibacillus sp.]|nr:alpha/beta hydrolase [Brevibacillus sp.]
MKIEFLTLSEGTRLQYSIRGEGPPVLVLHGGHSNCTEEFGYQALLDAGYSLITPSRPGYGETSRELGESLMTACQAYDELLRHLQIEKVHVIAVSAGGPSGIFFASQYSQRMRTLTLQSAVTGPWLTSKDKEYKVAQIMFRPGVEAYLWKLLAFMTDRFPKYMFKQMASSFTKLPWREVESYLLPEDVEAFRAMNRRQRSGHGFMIDLLHPGQIEVQHLEDVTCPVLIMHSRQDRTVPPEHAHRAYKCMPNAQLCLLDTWGHLIWLGKGSEQVHQELLSFLSQWEENTNESETSVPFSRID